MDQNLIKNSGLKVTKHKIAVLQLFDIHRHLDANKIYTVLISRGINISLATIYRILSEFEANSILVKHNFNDEQSTYELIHPNEHHDHLICIKCHKVVEFFNCEIEKTQEEIAKANKFRILNHQLNLFGLCEDCDK